MEMIEGMNHNTMWKRKNQNTDLLSVIINVLFFPHF